MRLNEIKDLGSPRKIKRFLNKLRFQSSYLKINDNAQSDEDLNKALYIIDILLLIEIDKDILIVERNINGGLSKKYEEDLIEKIEQKKMSGDIDNIVQFASIRKGIDLEFKKDLFRLNIDIRNYKAVSQKE